MISSRNMKTYHALRNSPFSYVSFGFDLFHVEDCKNFKHGQLERLSTFLIEVVEDGCGSQDLGDNCISMNCGELASAVAG